MDPSLKEQIDEVGREFDAVNSEYRKCFPAEIGFRELTEQEFSKIQAFYEHMEGLRIRWETLWMCLQRERSR